MSAEFSGDGQGALQVGARRYRDRALKADACADASLPDAEMHRFGWQVGLTNLGQPRLSEGAQPYPRQRYINQKGQLRGNRIIGRGARLARPWMTGPVIPT